MLIRMWFLSAMFSLLLASGPELSPDPFPKKGSKALEFKMTGLLNLSQHLGGAITYKSFSKDRKAFRVGIGVDIAKDWDSGNFEKIHYEVGGDSPHYDTTSYDIASPDFLGYSTLSFQAIKYQDPFHSVSLLYGVGGKLGYFINDHKIDYSNLHTLEGNVYTKNLVSERRVFIGLTALIGVEWFMNKNISFHSEYQTDLLLGKKERKEEWRIDYYSGDWNESNTMVSGNYIDITNRVLAGVSIYFK